MGLFDTSPWEQLTGSKSPFEVAFPSASKKIGASAPFVAQVGMIGTPLGAVSSIWSGLGTTGKVAVGVGAGAGGYAVYDWLFGGKKAASPQAQVQNQYTINKPVNTQSTTNTNITGDWSTNLVSNSPNATMKKGSITGTLTGSPLQNNPLTSNPSQAASQAQGTDFATIAAILGVAFVAATYFKGRAK